MFSDFDLSATMMRLAVTFVPVALGIIVHEVAHAWAAARCGDPTATMLGRITLNPIPHIDPMGLAFYVLTSLTSPFVLGWAKPVPINPRNFHHIKRDTFLVSFAGPASNFIQAILWVLALRLVLALLGQEQPSTLMTFLVNMTYAGVTINLSLAWFNLLPIPPMDGSKMLWTILPGEIGWRYMQLERYGMMVILVLVMAGVLRYVLVPLISVSASLLLALVGLGG